MIARRCAIFIFFFFNHTATTEIYTLSLHDALPIFLHHRCKPGCRNRQGRLLRAIRRLHCETRSEEHTSELQSRVDLVCRLLLEKKKKRTEFYDQQLDQLFFSLYF